MIASSDTFFLSIRQVDGTNCSRGRMKDCRWYNTGGSADVVRLKYGYDRASDRLWREDLVAQSYSQDFDELYSYDGLHRLNDMQRGLLNGSQTAITNETIAQCWSLDPTSNWHGFKEAATGGSWTLVQSRSANTVNEITGITSSTGPTWVSPAYDAAGNTTTIPQPADPTTSFTGTYDAWNRLAKLVDTPSGHTVQQNAYDPRQFRTVRLDYSSGTLSESRHFYYTSKWQSIEERLGSSPDSANAERQAVWGRRYVDDCVLRDRDTDGDGALDERLYGLQDANWNMVALLDTSAVAQERYLYSPYGSLTFLDGTMSTVRTDSAVDNGILFTGQRCDLLTLVHLFRHRWLESKTGRFIVRDPLGYQDSVNTYAASFAPHGTDPLGLCGCRCTSITPKLFKRQLNPALAIALAKQNGVDILPNEQFKFGLVLVDTHIVGKGDNSLCTIKRVKQETTWATVNGNKTSLLTRICG